jgi:hypothetical protein
VIGLRSYSSLQSSREAAPVFLSAEFHEEYFILYICLSAMHEKLVAAIDPSFGRSSRKLNNSNPNQARIPAPNVSYSSIDPFCKPKVEVESWAHLSLRLYLVSHARLADLLVCSFVRSYY